MYKPRTGRNAAKRNRKEIEKYLKENPNATGVEIQNALGLSGPTVYGHLAKITERFEKENV